MSEDSGKVSGVKRGVLTELVKKHGLNGTLAAAVIIYCFNTVNSMQDRLSRVEAKANTDKAQWMLLRDQDQRLNQVQSKVGAHQEILHWMTGSRIMDEEPPQASTPRPKTVPNIPPEIEDFQQQYERKWAQQQAK